MSNTYQRILKKLHLKEEKKNEIMMMQSDTLGMTIIEANENKQQLKILTPQQWINILQNKQLSGYSYPRIYFSFLKGIPYYMRMKIWLFFLTSRCTEQYKFTTKQSRKSVTVDGIVINTQTGQKQFTISLYEKLVNAEPLEKQRIQIDKDIHRSYGRKQQYKYTSSLLGRILYSLSNSGIQYIQGMNYILLNIILSILRSVGIDSEDKMSAINLEIQRNIFVICRQAIFRMESIFSSNNILQIIKQLEELIANSCPEVLYHIFKMGPGFDCYSMFSQFYYSLLTYSQPPEQLSTLFIDLFFLQGVKSIHAIIVRMLEINSQTICSIHSLEKLQQFLKKDMLDQYYVQFLNEKDKAQKLADFGLSFYSNIQQL